ncbi:MAG TPA: hypothetical protein VF316_07045 [Polyangiaceae bacterium]
MRRTLSYFSAVTDKDFDANERISGFSLVSIKRALFALRRHRPEFGLLQQPPRGADGRASSRVPKPKEENVVLPTRAIERDPVQEVAARALAPVIAYRLESLEGSRRPERGAREAPERRPDDREHVRKHAVLGHRIQFVVPPWRGTYAVTLSPRRARAATA